MGIKGLTDRGAMFPEIGRIRKGAPKGKNKPGEDLTYFRIEVDEREEEAFEIIQARYGDEPRELDVLLPFNTVSENFEAWREAYLAGGLIHRCDGERVWYEIDHETGEKVVTNGEPYKACDGETPVAYYGNNKPLHCTPTGRLKVLLQPLQRLAFFTVLTSSLHDIINLDRQLDAILQINGSLVGVPLKLRRRPLKISTPGEGGKRVRREKWLLSIEADPTWVKAKLTEMKAAALPGNHLGDEVPALEAPEDPEDVEEGEFTEVDETEPEPAAEKKAEKPKAPNGDRPYSPDSLKDRIGKSCAAYANDIASGKVETPSEGDFGAVMGNLEKCFAGDPESDRKRHSVLAFLFGVDSGKDLMDGEILALKKWLNAKQDSGGDWSPDPLAVKEARAVLKERMKDLGQEELI